MKRNAFIPALFYAASAFLFLFSIFAIIKATKIVYFGEAEEVYLDLLGTLTHERLIPRRSVFGRFANKPSGGKLSNAYVYSTVLNGLEIKIKLEKYIPPGIATVIYDKGNVEDAFQGNEVCTGVIIGTKNDGLFKILWRNRSESISTLMVIPVLLLVGFSIHKWQ